MDMSQSATPTQREQRNKMGTSVFSAIEFWVGGRQGDWLPGRAHLFYPLGNPLRWSGDSMRQESGSESPQDQEELSPNPNFPELTASSLKHGLVRLGEGQEGRQGW